MPTRQRKETSPGTARHQLGNYWLWYRDDRDDWNICWYSNARDGSGRRTSRKSLGIGGSGGGVPPKEAQDALAAHYLASHKPASAPIASVYVEKLMADWLLEYAMLHLADPGRYATGITHWQSFFALEQNAGRLPGPPTVADISTTLVERFHAWRKGQGVGAHTIARDTAHYVNL